MKKLVTLATAIMTSLIDKRTEFADAAAITGNAATEAILGSVIPMDTTGFNLGASMSPVYLVISIDTTVLAAGGAANVTFKLKSDAVATLDGAGVVTHFSSGAIAKGDLTAGTIAVCVALPHGTYGKYIGVTFTPDTNNTTAGKANAYLTLDPPGAWKAYPNAI